MHSNWEPCVRMDLPMIYCFCLSAVRARPMRRPGRSNAWEPRAACRAVEGQNRVAPIVLLRSPCVSARKGVRHIGCSPHPTLRIEMNAPNSSYLEGSFFRMFGGMILSRGSLSHEGSCVVGLAILFIGLGSTKQPQAGLGLGSVKWSSTAQVVPRP